MFLTGHDFQEMISGRSSIDAPVGIIVGIHVTDSGFIGPTPVAIVVDHEQDLVISSRVFHHPPGCSGGRAARGSQSWRCIGATGIGGPGTGKQVACSHDWTPAIGLVKRDHLMVHPHAVDTADEEMLSILSRWISPACGQRVWTSAMSRSIDMRGVKIKFTFRIDR